MYCEYEASGYFLEHLTLISGELIELLIDHHGSVSWSANAPPPPLYTAWFLRVYSQQTQKYFVNIEKMFDLT